MRVRKPGSKCRVGQNNEFVGTVCEIRIRGRGDVAYFVRYWVDEKLMEDFIEADMVSDDYDAEPDPEMIEVLVKSVEAVGKKKKIQFVVTPIMDEDQDEPEPASV